MVGVSASWLSSQTSLQFQLFDEPLVNLRQQSGELFVDRAILLVQTLFQHAGSSRDFPAGLERQGALHEPGIARHAPALAVRARVHKGNAEVSSHQEPPGRGDRP